VRASLFLYVGLFAIAFSWRVVARGQSLLLAAPDARVDWLRDPLLGLGAAVLVIGLSSALTRHTRIGRELARALGSLVGPLERRHSLALAATSSVGEEALFRGALQPEVGLVAASLVFALAHLVPRRALLPWSAFSLAAGLLLGALFDATGNLVAPVVAHFGINAVNLDRLSHEYGRGDH